jgi:fermentation-respiration switch protein FrsA (DUF1100 family)
MIQFCSGRCRRRLVVCLIALAALGIWWLPRGFTQSTDAMAGPKLYERFVFFPARFPEGDWSPQMLDFQDVWFSAADDVRLHGWYCPAKSPRAVVLLAHGNAGHIASRAEWLAFLQRELCVSVFAFDYRGYGRSEGVPTIEGALADARAARAKLCELARVTDSQIVLMGESLGGAVAVQLAAEQAPRAVILQSTFSSLREIAQVHFRSLAWLVPSGQLDSVAQIPKYQGPLLISHGQQDRTVPLALGRRLFDAAREPKQWVVLPAADHNDWLTDAYCRQLDQFLSSLNGPAEGPAVEPSTAPPAAPSAPATRPAAER